MNDGFQYSQADWEKDVKLLRLMCLIGALLSPAISFFWNGLQPDFNLHFYIFIPFSAVFIIIFVLTYKSNFFKERSNDILFAICCLCSLAALVSQVLGFTVERSFIHYFVTFTTILVVRKIIPLLVYLAATYACLTILILNESTVVNKFDRLSVMLLFFLIAAINVKLRLDSQKALRESELHYKGLVESSPFAIIVHNSGKILYANKMAENTLGMPDLCRLLDNLETGGEIAAAQDPKAAQVSGEKGLKELGIMLPDGSKREFEAYSIEVAHLGKPAQMSFITDITEKKENEDRVRKADAIYKTFVDSTLVGLYLIKDKRVAYINSYIENLLGYKSEEFSNINPFSLVTEGAVDPSEAGNYSNGKVIRQFKLAKRDGSHIHVETHQYTYNSNGSEVKIGILLDISHIKRAEERIRKMAYHDALTGLPNRYQLGTYVSETLEHCSQNNLKLGIMFLDMDRFKSINDTFGHTYGDKILKQAASRLESCVRKGDIVCRHGGDEFVVILKGTGRSEIAQVAHRIINAFSYPFKLSNYEVYTTPSIGISFFPDDGDNAEILVRKADAAMYSAKQNGKNNFQFFSTGIGNAIEKNMELENGLRRALSNGEFELHYQPQVELSTGRVAGMEALIRWRHPVLGLIPPSDFIPLAEETGLIISIGEWVLETACMKNKSWQTSGLANIPIAVNVSGLQLQHSNFVKTVKRVLERSKLEPAYLVIEMTESVMQDVSVTNRIVRELNCLGVKVAVDDFGTGYSSLNLLKNLSIDILKIDPSFIRDTNTNQSSVILTKFIIDMGHELKYDIIAEGIEEEEHAAILLESNCDIGQGYYYSRPLTGEMAEKLLREEKEKRMTG